jgi:hypothetical protein
MRTAAATLIAFALAAGVADAQGRGRRSNSQGIPPGHLPAAGQCRVWYDGVPPGRQPAPTNCDAAERRAARDPNARVIYGDHRYRDDGRDDPRYENRDRTVNGGSPIGDRIRDAMRSRYPTNVSQNSAPFRNGYDDGLEKGREDARDNDSFDPVRHSRYRSADRGYQSRYGTRDSYKLYYRDGFEAGYEDGYRSVRGYARRW